MTFLTTFGASVANAIDASPWLTVVLHDVTQVVVMAIWVRLGCLAWSIALSRSVPPFPHKKFVTTSEDDSPVSSCDEETEDEEVAADEGMPAAIATEAPCTDAAAGADKSIGDLAGEEEISDEDESEDEELSASETDDEIVTLLGDGGDWAAPARPRRRNTADMAAAELPGRPVSGSGVAGAG
eukprot:CAMPEP_0170276368 /NCGR_PEP_ID=MMETSP0116_2-20130129/38168_1 /TAXON_ID=400756 /ORGANISM="Durinskia baltica, Strain CSIRO CS-38" /LENGTH=182 /DNA_ID=CAMNT_0010527639 /DNA_START=77 /DNA_END=623 /DNA_ORIENTATION=+